MKIRLQTKATIGIALLVLLILMVSGWFFFYAASKALDAEMGQRLIAIASASAAEIKGEYLNVLQPGSENTRLYQNLQRKLQSMRDATGARQIYIFDFGGKSLVNSGDDVSIGSRYRTLDADQIHVERAKQGTAAASTAFHGKDDRFYKSAYAPVRDGKGDIVAVLAVDASVLFLETLERMRRNMMIIGIAGTVIAIWIEWFVRPFHCYPYQKIVTRRTANKRGRFWHTSPDRSGRRSRVAGGNI